MNAQNKLQRTCDIQFNNQNCEQPRLLIRLKIPSSVIHTGKSQLDIQLNMFVLLLDVSNALHFIEKCKIREVTMISHFKIAEAHSQSLLKWNGVGQFTLTGAGVRVARI